MKKKQALEILNTLKDKQTNLKNKAKELKVTIISQKGNLNKGWAGITLDRILGGGDNKQKADHVWGEIKSFPVYKKKDGKLAAKETMQITMIEKDLNKLTSNFIKSHVFEKMKKMIIIARKYGQNFELDSNGSQFIHAVFEFNLTGETLQKLKKDYEYITNSLKLNNDAISKRFNGELIQSRTKGQGGNSRKSYGFYALPKFLNSFLN